MLPPPDAVDSDLLDFVAGDRKTTSRLSCQIKLVAQLDGIEVTIPERQVFWIARWRMVRALPTLEHA